MLKHLINWNPFICLLITFCWISQAWAALHFNYAYKTFWFFAQERKANTRSLVCSLVIVVPGIYVADDVAVWIMCVFAYAPRDIFYIYIQYINYNEIYSEQNNDILRFAWCLQCFRFPLFSQVCWFYFWRSLTQLVLNITKRILSHINAVVAIVPRRIPLSEYGKPHDSNMDSKLLAVNVIYLEIFCLKLKSIFSRNHKTKNIEKNKVIAN